jgi:hypothetical protein
MRMRYAVLALTAIMGMSGAFAQCLITGFEGYTLGANGVVLFRQPSFSGSTSGFVASTGVCNIPNGVYNCALISDEQAFSGTQSLKVAWQFRLNPATGQPFPNAWLRLTTFNTPNIPNPAINFAHRVRVRLYVPSDTPDFYLTLGVRETDTTAPCGRDGGVNNPNGVAGGIEWIGATSAQGNNAPVGKLVNQKDQWVTVKFDIRRDLIRAFAGGRRMDRLTATQAQSSILPSRLLTLRTSVRISSTSMMWRPMCLRLAMWTTTAAWTTLTCCRCCSPSARRVKTTRM